ncbi:hypothetical protein RSAG8_11991, partial [Rhizoctonia solani AG-8 WAC10335]
MRVHIRKNPGSNLPKRTIIENSLPIFPPMAAIHHQTYPFGNVLDEAKTYLALSKADVRDIPEISEKIFFGYYVHLRRKFGSDLDNKLLNDTPDWEFRNTLSQQLQLGRSQARTDDIAVLKEVCPYWLQFSHLPFNHTRGWATDEYAQALRTPDLDLNNPELRLALTQGLTDAPSHHYFAGLFPDNKFPTEGQHPLEGFCRGSLFVDAALGVYRGPRASKHLPPSAGGRRSKAVISGMTSMTRPAIAYVAMLLRFTLHQVSSWYSIDSPNDSRFNYFRFYSEVLALLQEEEFKPEVDALIVHLNKIIFPHLHILPQDGPSAGAQSTREKALAIVRARRTHSGTNAT